MYDIGAQESKILCASCPQCPIIAMFLPAVGLHCSMHAITLAALLQMAGTLAVVIHREKFHVKKRTFSCFVSLGRHFLPPGSSPEGQKEETSFRSNRSF